MRRKWMIIVLPLIGVVACGAGVLLQTQSQHCAASPWFCNEAGMLRDFWMMALPLLFLLGRGLWLGMRQLRRTSRVVHAMLRLTPVPPSQVMRVLADELNLTGRIDIVTCDAPEAFCYGLVRPRICLTSGLLVVLTPAEIEAVLRHERHHLRHYDPLRTVFWTILSGAFWWLEDRAEHAHLLRELAADRAVIAEQGRTSLASALLKLLTVPRPGSLPSAQIAISGLSVTDARIDQLVRSEQIPGSTSRHWQWLVLPTLLVLTMLFCSVVMARVWA
ncbi:MAG: M56 family metallopeptidase [Chloroflexota bacterium]|nr:M56 family metallopeptidase [Chloroflexota bacterium]